MKRIKDTQLCAFQALKDRPTNHVSVGYRDDTEEDNVLVPLTIDHVCNS